MFGKNQKKNPTRYDLLYNEDTNHNNPITGVNDIYSPDKSKQR